MKHISNQELSESAPVETAGLALPAEAADSMPVATGLVDEVGGLSARSVRRAQIIQSGRRRTERIEASRVANARHLIVQCRLVERQVEGLTEE